MNDFEVIDLREQFFKVSNTIFKKDLDIYEIGVYTVLCRFTCNEKKESFPSYNKIAEMLKISRTKVIGTIKLLINKGIIAKKTGTRVVSNRYYLLNFGGTPDALVHTIDQGSTYGVPEVVHEVDSKKTNIKRLKEKDLYSVYGVNKNIKFTNTEYSRLETEFGKNKTLEMIDYLSNYKIEKGYTTKSDNLTIRRWVVDACNAKKKKLPKQLSESAKIENLAREKGVSVKQAQEYLKTQKPNIDFGGVFE